MKLQMNSKSRCSLCNKKTRHPNDVYCRDCKKELKNILLHQEYDYHADYCQYKERGIDHKK